MQAYDDRILMLCYYRPAMRAESYIIKLSARIAGLWWQILQKGPSACSDWSKPVFYGFSPHCFYIIKQNNEEAYTVNYTVMIHSRNSRTLLKCRKHMPAARVFYFSIFVFSIFPLQYPNHAQCHSIAEEITQWLKTLYKSTNKPDLTELTVPYENSERDTGKILAKKCLANERDRTWR